MIDQYPAGLTWAGRVFPDGRLAPRILIPTTYTSKPCLGIRIGPRRAAVLLPDERDPDPDPPDDPDDPKDPEDPPEDPPEEP